MDNKNKMAAYRPDMVDEPTFRALSWNVLAQACATGDDKGFPLSEPEALDASKRLALTFEVLDAHEADIITLQEVDQPAAFTEHLESKGYEVIYHKRHNSVLGLLTAYQVPMFSFVSEQCSSLGGHGQIAQCVELELPTPVYGRVVVFNAHLKSVGLGDEASARINKLQQIAVRSMVSEHKCTSYNYHVLLCGDMNGTIDSADVIGMRPGMVSCYEDEPTTFKTRKDADGALVEKVAAEDVLCTTAPIVRIARIRRPSEGENWPSTVFPSDHSVLCADMRLL